MMDYYVEKAMKQYQGSGLYIMFLSGADRSGNRKFYSFKLFGKWDEVLETMNKRKAFFKETEYHAKTYNGCR